MRQWLIEKKPDIIFEMNRVKSEIPILDEKKIPHVSWVVDFKGRDETTILGSDITYFFDPEWENNYNTGGLQDWLPPGTCVDTFYPNKNQGPKRSEFNFIGHIPKPWSKTELDRRLHGSSKKTFHDLLKIYNEQMRLTQHLLKTHKDLADIIKKITVSLTGKAVSLPIDMKYDLMERNKRMANRTALLDLVKKKSDSIEIYGSTNWKDWPQYTKYYKHFVDNANEMNDIHQQSHINLHDGVSFHFRAIDCMASGGLLFHLFIPPKRDKQKPRRGLHDFFDKQSHYVEMNQDNFDVMYERVKRCPYSGSRWQKETIKEIMAHHTWAHRTKKIVNDINRL